MNSKILTKELTEDNERISLDNAKRDGYVISNLDGYPKTKDHLRCYTDLPCKIEKGRDEFPSKKRWYVIFDSNINIEDNSFSTLSEAIRYATLKYTNFLQKQLKDIKTGKLK